jgi:hypothetical protein
MPHPDPNGLDLEENDDGSWRVTAEVWPHGNRRHRIARLVAVARNIRHGGWKCCRCGTEIALFKRADARFCGEQCRKAAARWRREIRSRRDPLSMP